MWPSVEVPRAEPRPEAGPQGVGSRRSSNISKLPAPAPAVTRELPSFSNSRLNSAIPVPSSPNEVGRRLGTMTRAGMERWRDRLALVTGASGGIGAAVARALVQQGLKVVGCARTVGNIEVNVLALSICTREAYQSMKERNVDDGHIININRPIKFRLSRTSLLAQCISPGLVETQFAFKLYDKDPREAAATYEHIKCLRPEDVAEAVIYVLSTPPHVQVGDIQMRPTEQVT
nr:dehydrogenase/reductase SDR family member 11 isoform X5 [Rattus norvegicus]